MKIKNSIVLFNILAASIVFAIPSMASECINNSTGISSSSTNDSISVKARIRKSFGSFPIYTNQDYVFGCSVIAKMLLNYTIPDDSPISSLDIYIYINGRQLSPTK